MFGCGATNASLRRRGKVGTAFSWTAPPWPTIFLTRAPAKTKPRALRFLLDTHIAIYVIKNKPLSALHLFNHHAGQMAVSAITLAELLHGAEKNNAPERSLGVVEDFCARLEGLP